MNLVRTVSLFALASAALSARANLVTNPGFETGDFSGWTVSNPDGAYFQVDGVIPHGGLYDSAFGFEDGGVGTLSQTIATTAGATYTVSFYLFGLAANPSADSFGVSFGGATLATFVGTSSDNVLYSYTAFASSASSTLAFTFQRGDGQAGAYLLDDVSVTQNAVTSVPGPAAALPFALMALKRRRKA